ncbi:hypothetical protein D3C74_365120 [compost metagenome]
MGDATLLIEQPAVQLHFHHRFFRSINECTHKLDAGLAAKRYGAPFAIPFIQPSHTLSPFHHKFGIGYDPFTRLWTVIDLTAIVLVDVRI